jgi:asparagine synthetase B (glutamine-hydrolysing)
MSNIFVVISRELFLSGSDKIEEDLSTICRRMTPDNISNKSSVVNINQKDCLAVSLADSKIEINNTSVITGLIGVPEDRWWEKSTVSEDASFLCSVSEERCILSANSTASRAIWYFYDETRLIVSSSQKAIVSWLGSFHLNYQAISWMLAAGNLGPGNSWDNRIQHLKAGEIVNLNRHSWEISKTKKIDYINSFPIQNHKLFTEQLDATFHSVFKNAVFDLTKSRITLSGGYDSRAVLYYLIHHGVNIKSITWGLSSSLKDPFSDSSIARRIADHLKVENEYFLTDFVDNKFEPLFEKFLRFGEGRLDHINSFMDGFKMWETLHDAGVRNIIRADEAFGWLPSRTEQDVRISLDMHLMEDNSNMFPLQKFNIEPQSYPDWFSKNNDESIDVWRDRLYRQFRIPYVLTSLHDLVHPYVEVFNPFLHEKIVNFSMGLPDNLRTNKKLYSQFVNKLVSDIPFASKPSIPEPSAILQSAKIVSFILDEMNSQDTRNLLNGNMINWIQKNMSVDDQYINQVKDNWTGWFKNQVPWQVKKMIRKGFIKYTADFNQLAFRTLIIKRMNKMMKEESSILEVKS